MSVKNVHVCLFMVKCEKNKQKKTKNKQTFEPVHDKIYAKTCATSKDSEHLRRLIRDFADRMCILQLPGHPKREEREPLPYRVDV